MNSILTTGFIETLMGWLQSLMNSLISLIGGSEGGSLLKWLASHWKGLLVFLFIVGCGVNVFIYLVRWRPQWWWFARKRMVIDDSILTPKKKSAPKVKPSSIVPIHAKEAGKKDLMDTDDDDLMTPKKKKK